jgi:hypothetical protein
MVLEKNWKKEQVKEEKEHQEEENGDHHQHAKQSNIG